MPPLVSLTPTWSEERLPFLDGLRALSIFFVLAFHVFLASKKLPSMITRIFCNGDLGVSLFFVISGFIITTLLIRENQRSGTVSLKNFYIRRTIRILPVLYVYLIFIFAMSIFCGLPVVWQDIAKAGTFTLMYFSEIPNQYVGHIWSLAVEEGFYLVWPFLFWRFGRRQSLKMALVGIALSPLLRVATYVAIPAWRNHTQYMPHTRADTILCGALLALLMNEAGGLRFLERCFSLQLHWCGIIWATLVAPNITIDHQRGYMLSIGYSLEGFSFALFIGWLLIHRPVRIGALLESRLLTHIGIVSYSLYLWQSLFTPREHFFRLDYFPLNILPIFLMAELSYRFVEKPLQSVQKRYRSVNNFSQESHELRRIV